jgi:hypothetical protein
MGLQRRMDVSGVFVSTHLLLLKIQHHQKNIVSHLRLELQCSVFSVHVIHLIQCNAPSLQNHESFISLRSSIHFG